MILVTDMKVVKTHDKKHYFPLMHFDPLVIGHYDDEIAELVMVTREMVKGRRFRNVKGIDVVMGWDQRSQELLGLPFKAFEQMEKRRQSDFEENTRLRKRIRELESMSLWGFLKRKLKSIW